MNDQGVQLDKVLKNSSNLNWFKAYHSCDAPYTFLLEIISEYLAEVYEEIC